MIDNFALAVSHGLILLAFWRLLRRPDLDDDALSPPASAGREIADRRSEPPGA